MPYQTLTAQLPVGVMIGHMEVPGLTDADHASLSPAAVALLRNGTGYGAPPFDGPVFTDDLGSMKAITDRYGISDAVLKALQAGTTPRCGSRPPRFRRCSTSWKWRWTRACWTMPKIEASVRRMASAKALGSGCGH